jgi:phosphoglycerate dehydrogenase-like enzyme
MRPRIVIPADHPPQLQGTSHLQRLEAYGDVVLFRDRPVDDDEAVRRALGATCLINSRGAVKWPGHLLRRLPDLKMITTCGIGTDSIDVDAARQLGMVVCNIPGQTAPIVAEHALALMLAAARRLSEQTDVIKRGGWKVGFNTYLRGKMLGVVGTGSIGAAMLELGRAIGMQTQAWTFHASAERARDLHTAFVPLDDLLRTSDVVSIHVKLTDQTRGLIGRRELGLMKPAAILVNTARGAVVDNIALAEALAAGRLGGGGIDVFEVEPVPPDHPLLKCASVVLTPHVADQNVEGMEILNRGAVENVIAFLEGRPQNRVV